MSDECAAPRPLSAHCRAGPGARPTPAKGRGAPASVAQGSPFPPSPLLRPGPRRAQGLGPLAAPVHDPAAVCPPSWQASSPASASPPSFRPRGQQRLGCKSGLTLKPPDLVRRVGHRTTWAQSNVTLPQRHDLSRHPGQPWEGPLISPRGSRAHGEGGAGGAWPPGSDTRSCDRLAGCWETHEHAFRHRRPRQRRVSTRGSTRARATAIVCAARPPATWGEASLGTAPLAPQPPACRRPSFPEHGDKRGGPLRGKSHPQPASHSPGPAAGCRLQDQRGPPCVSLRAQLCTRTRSSADQTGRPGRSWGEGILERESAHGAALLPGTGRRGKWQDPQAQAAPSWSSPRQPAGQSWHTHPSQAS